MSAEFPKQESVPVEEDKETKMARLRAELAALENEGSEEKVVSNEVESQTEAPPAVSDIQAEERAVADASALASLREKLGMAVGNEAQRLSPTEMGDQDLERIWKAFDKRQQESENVLEEKVREHAGKRREFQRPILEQIDTLLEDKDSFPDTETLEQVTEINNIAFRGVLNKLEDEEVIARFGKAILFLGEKGILTDEIIAEGAAIQDYDAALVAEGRKIQGGDGDPDYDYAQEYHRRELAR